MISLNAMNCWLVVNIPRIIIRNVVPFIDRYLSCKYDFLFTDQEMESDGMATLWGNSFEMQFHFFLMCSFAWSFIIFLFVNIIIFEWYQWRIPNMHGKIGSKWQGGGHLIDDMTAVIWKYWFHACMWNSSCMKSHDFCGCHELLIGGKHTKNNYKRCGALHCLIFNL